MRRITSVLKSPMTGSASALSKLSPMLPARSTAPRYSWRGTDSRRRAFAGMVSIPPERKKFETRADSAIRNILNFSTSHNLTKIAVVQLRERKWPERGAKRPETVPQAGAGGSVVWAQSPTFCAVQAEAAAPIENVRSGFGHEDGRSGA
jgi:hypothetical protein